MAKLYISPKEASALAKKQGINDLAPITIRKYARRERYGFKLAGRFYISPEKFTRWIDRQKKKGGLECLQEP